MESQKPAGLLRLLGLGFGLAVVVGNSIGSGILRMPGVIAGYLSNEWLVMLLWVLGGCLALIGSLIYAEASTAYPYSGGPYAIAEKVFGKQTGFSVGICDWISNSGGNAALAIAGAEFITSIEGYSVRNVALASGIILLFSAMQWFGIRSSSITQQVLSALKALALILLVIAFMFHSRIGGAMAAPISNAVPHTAFFGALILSFRSIIYTYSSWNAPIYFSEENVDPQKSLPRSLIGGVIVLSIIYILVNVAVLHLLPINAIANSPLAVAYGANLVFGNAGKMLVTIVSVIIVLSCLYAGILYPPRIIFGVSRSGLFFPSLARLNRFRIPGTALISTTLVVLVFTLSGTYIFITSVFTFLYLFIDMSVYASALWSRWKQKTPLSFKAPLFPLPHIFMILINMALVISVYIEDPKSSIYAVIIMLGTIPLYYIMKMVLNDAGAVSGS